SALSVSNPTKINYIIELYAIWIIPFALAFTFCRMVKDKRQGYAVFAIMGVLWLGTAIAIPVIESGGNPKLDTGGVSQAVRDTSPGGNMEGKEVRFGPSSSGLWGGSTTGTSNGSVNSMHDSFTPLGATLEISMLFGRFFLIIPTLALAGSVVRKRRVPATVGTFPTTTPLFVTLVIGVAVIVAALAFLPALALGPIVEQLKI